MFSCMKISYTFCRHLGPQILSLVNTNNQPNGRGKKGIIFLKMDFITFKKITLYII